MTVAAHPIRRDILRSLLVAFVLAGPVRSESNGPVTLGEVRHRMTALVSQERFALTTWGIRVESLNSGAIVYATNDHRLLQPASTAKLFSGAYALDTLGPDYRIRTSVLAREAPTRRGVLAGDLIIQGRGDFSAAARFNGGDYDRSLDPLVRAIRTAGIAQVQGDLVADARWFSGPPWGTGWTWDDLDEYYGAEVSALNIEDNTIDLVVRPGGKPGEPCAVLGRPRTDYVRLVNRTTTAGRNGERRIRVDRAPGSREVWVSGQLPVGSAEWKDAVSVPRPALWFAHLLRDRLSREHIQIRGAVRALEWDGSGPETVKSPSPLRELGFAESPPLRTLLSQTLKASQNQYAQLLLIQAGTPGQATVGTASEAAAVAGMRKFITRLGINPQEVLLDEGSGLSRTARVTAAAEVALLRAMARHPQSNVFREALPVAGKEGTLRERMQGTPAEGRLQAKTGTLAGVHALAGFVTTRAGETLVLSILVNQHPEADAAAAREDVDDLAILLASLAERTRTGH